jgi:hypothetical protein
MDIRNVTSIGVEIIDNLGVLNDDTKRRNSLEIFERMAIPTCWTQDQTTSPALPMMGEQVDDKDQTEVEMAPFATEGAEGIAKCPSTWPAHFATLAKLATASSSQHQRCLFI